MALLCRLQTGGASHSVRFGGYRSQCQNTLGFNKAALPVGTVQAVDAYATAAAAAGMDELVIAQVNACMAHTTAAAVIKEDHVTGLKVAAFYQRRIKVDHLAGR